MSMNYKQVIAGTSDLDVECLMIKQISSFHYLDMTFSHCISLAHSPCDYGECHAFLSINEAAHCSSCSPCQNKTVLLVD